RPGTVAVWRRYSGETISADAADIAMAPCHTDPETGTAEVPILPSPIPREVPIEVDQNAAGILRLDYAPGYPAMGVEGEFDATLGALYLDALREVAPAGGGDVHLDLARVRFLGLSALNLLVRRGKETDGS